MPVFKTQVHEDLWIEANCGTCFERHEAARRLHGKDTQCPILARYHRRKRKPAEWERTRDPLMTKTIKCNEHMARPESIKGSGVKDFEDVPMFDVEPVEDVPLVPVPGWPDRPTKRGTDHA